MPAQAPVSCAGGSGAGRRPRARVAGIVLAAGSSSRMGPERNKLVEQVGGRPLVAWSVDALLEAGIDPVVVVTGFESERVRAALGDRPCRFVHHEAWAEGMGSSLARGMREVVELSPPPQAVLVCVGDLPGLRAAAVERVLEAALGEDAGGRALDPTSIVLPVHRGRRGHPVAFGAHYFSELARLSGDEGGRAILDSNPGSVRWIELDGESILRDVDTPAELEAARREIGSE